MNSGKSLKSKLSSFLRYVSLGKYQTVLFINDKENYQSSVIGGILTIMIAIVLITYSSIVMNDIFDKRVFHLDQEYVPLSFIKYDSKVSSCDY